MAGDDRSAPFVSIIVPALNAEWTMGDCLTAIGRTRVPPGGMEVLVVDNGSTDRTSEIVARHQARLILEPRRGVSHARNRGIAESRGSIVILIDADCLATGEWLIELTAPFKDPSVAAAAGEVLAYPSATRAERYIARRKPFWQEWTRRGGRPWFLGGNVAFRREVFDRIGWFDSRFPNAAAEDIDLSWRFFGAGLRVAHCPRAVAFHRHRQTLRGLFTQQVKNGRGQAVLCKKYRDEIKWGLGNEVSAWADLARSAPAAVVALLRTALDKQGQGPLDDVDFLRKLAQRIGFVRGALEWNSFPAVTVIVPARNAEATIGACVESVLRGEYPADSRHTIVVDNASSDGTAAIARRLGVECIREPALGPSSARNRGIEASSTELLAFIDADCVASAGWLRELVSGFDATDVGAVAGEILAYPPRTAGERYMAMRHPLWQKHALAMQRPYAVTANLAVRRQTFQRIGAFDPRLTRGQDMDFGWRFFRDGTLRMAYRGKALVFHRHRATARAFFRQQVGWGRGHALLHAKHGLPWSLLDELTKYAEAGVAVGTLAGAVARYATRGGDRMQVGYPYFELLRRIGGRVGALQGFLETRTSRRSRPAWQDETAR